MCYLRNMLVIVSLVSASRVQDPCSSLDGKCDDGTACLSSSSEVYPPGLRPSNVSCVSDMLPQTRRRRQVTGPGSCILPPFPFQGAYVVSGTLIATPGLPFDSFKLTVGCRRGFGFTETDGIIGISGIQTVFCSNGKWTKPMPECVRFCKLEPDSSVQYMCHVPGVGFKACQGYVAPGTMVQAVCNTPIYYSTEGLRYMNCVSGYWDHIAQCKAECGRVTPKAEQLLVGGGQAKRGELPWHAAIFTKTTSPYMQICGGSLVSNNVVISAAHCFWDDKMNGPLSASNYAVALGKIYRSWDNDTDFSAQKSDVKEIRIPRLFQGHSANLQEDIAAVILSTPIIYKTYVRPVCVNFNMDFEKWQLQHGKLGKVAGWGLNDAYGVASPFLKTVNVPYISEDICINNLPQTFKEYFTADKFCAGYLNGTALCKGDSGGGLAFADKEFGIDRFYLRGVVSAVPSDDDKLCNDYTYTTFTKITKHEEFIKQSLAVSVNKACPPNVFQCNDGACVDLGADCNGRQDCADGSDESDELCVPNISTINVSPNCALPYPDNGAYDVSNLPNDIVKLTLRCEEGFSIEGFDDYEVTNTTLFCANGEWSKPIPKCVLFCRIKPDPKVCFLCNDKKTNTLKECTEYVTPGTSVKPVCTNPGTFTQTLENMTCISGTWDFVANCDTECGQSTLDEQSERNRTGFKTLNRGDMPWIVIFYQKSVNYNLPLCSGSIISYNAVITSSHCTVLHSKHDYEAFAGKLFTRDDERDVDYLQKSDIKEFIYSDKESLAYYYAVAVCILVTPFTYTSVVKPVCVSFEGSNNLENQLGKFSASLSDREDRREGKRRLKYIDIKNLNFDECHQKISPLLYTGETLNNDRMCFSFAKDSNHSSILGFGGSGLVFAHKESNAQRFYLHSIISFILLPCTSNGVLRYYVKPDTYFKGSHGTSGLSCTEMNVTYLWSTTLYYDKEFIKKYM